MDGAENIKTELEFFEKVEEVIDSHRSSGLEILGLNTAFCLCHQKMIDPLTKQYWSVQKHLDIFEKSVILVRKESGIKSLADLNGKHVTTRHKNYLGRLILEKELLEQVHTGPKSHIKKIMKTQKASTVLLKTFFGKSDACFVPILSMFHKES